MTDAQLIANLALRIDDVVRVCLDHLDQDSPGWVGLIYSSLRNMQREIDDHDRNRLDRNRVGRDGDHRDATNAVDADAAQVKECERVKDELLSLAQSIVRTGLGPVRRAARIIEQLSVK